MSRTRPTSTNGARARISSDSRGTSNSQNVGVEKLRIGSLRDDFPVRKERPPARCQPERKARTCAVELGIGRYVLVFAQVEDAEIRQTLVNYPACDLNRLDGVEASTLPPNA